MTSSVTSSRWVWPNMKIRTGWAGLRWSRPIMILSYCCYTTLGLDSSGLKTACGPDPDPQRRGKFLWHPLRCGLSSTFFWPLVVVVVVVASLWKSVFVLVDIARPCETGNQRLRLPVIILNGLFTMAPMLSGRRTVLPESDSASALPWQPDDDVTRR